MALLSFQIGKLQGTSFRRSMGSLSQVDPIDASNSIGLPMAEALRERTINMPTGAIAVKVGVAKCSSLTKCNMVKISKTMTASRFM